MAYERELNDGSKHVVEERDEARQGTELNAMRYVLVISTIGAAVLMGAALLYYY